MNVFTVHHKSFKFICRKNEKSKTKPNVLEQTLKLKTTKFKKVTPVIFISHVKRIFFELI